MEEHLYRYNPWWEGEYKLKGIIQREASLNSLKKHLGSKQIVLVTGLRRVGKTTLLKLLIKDLIGKRLASPKHIFYISLDDYALSNKDIMQLVEEYRKTHKISFQQKIFLFFDEVTCRENYDIQLKNLHDNQNVKIFASSSSASILKSKKPYLTGRNAVVEILPLDFREYLYFKNINISKQDSSLTEKYFDEFLTIGGLPEYVLHGDVGYLQELIDDIIYKDIVSVHGIKNPKILKDMFMLLMERSGKIVSINKIARILAISPDSAKRYLHMFSDAYLIYLVSRFGKTNEKILSPKKLYAADLGIRTFFTGPRDKGSLFENYVYFKIKDKDPYYLYEDKAEIDFYTNEGTLIEAKYHSEMTKKQAELFKSVKAKNKLIINNINDIERSFD